jgi:hypothetical protein
MLFLLPKGVKNLANQEQGELTPKYIISVTAAEGAVWHCICCCGKTRDVPAKNLTAGRVTRCIDCANRRRTKQLHAAYKRANSGRGDASWGARRSWQSALEGLTPEQRTVYEDLIESRRRHNITITDAIHAGAVEVALMTATRRAA